MKNASLTRIFRDGVSGAFFSDRREIECPFRDAALRGKLWALLERQAAL
jgi:hypothetical protein